MEATSIAASPGIPQHMQALARANRVRLARAEVKRAISKGEVSVAEVVMRNPEELETMTVAELLRCQRHWGRTRTRHLLDSLDLSEVRTVGRLTERQRLALAAALDSGTRLN